MEPPRLKPRGWRVALYFAAVLAGVVVPVVGGLMLGFLGPPPFILDREALKSAPIGTMTSANGANLEVKPCESAAEAAELAEQIQSQIRKRSYEKTLHVHRYVRDDNGRSGLILPVEEVVVHLEAGDRSQLDKAFESLPFVVENPEKNVIYLLFTEHLTAFFWGLGIYVLLYALAMTRGGAWAAKVEPPAGAIALSADDLQGKLLELNTLDLPFQIREANRGYLVAEWRLAAAKWTKLFEKGGLKIAHSVRMKLDGRQRIVRAVDLQKRIQWSAGLARAAWSFSLFRGISFYQVERAACYGVVFKNGAWKFDAAYRYGFNLNEIKHPVVEAIVLSGWTYQPVVTFFRPLGG